MAAVSLTAAAPLHAADAFFIRFNAMGKSNSLFATGWRDDILFYNTNLAPVDVKFVGGSNGAPAAPQPSLTIPLGIPISLNASPVATAWRAPGLSSLSVLHLDIPPGVVVESRDEVFADSLVGFPSAFPAGKVSMPIFRQLAPANAKQIILGTDLMANATRINVGVYNGGDQTASANIEIRRVGDDSIVDTRTISVDANTLVQVGGFSVGALVLPTNFRLYTIVTVSEPSLVYVVNLNETLTQPGSMQGLFPIVGLAVAGNQIF